ncbi:unnamed protein product [Amoebophrya sp. A25]|nr:unnamed protein product [Amoebophrya sp. A25]|eukprot:GSA25T00022174001.1
MQPGRPEAETGLDGRGWQAQGRGVDELRMQLQMLMMNQCRMMNKSTITQIRNKCRMAKAHLSIPNRMTSLCAYLLMVSLWGYFQVVPGVAFAVLIDPEEYLVRDPLPVYLTLSLSFVVT